MILARALARRAPYAVKVHGSALEYTVKPEPQRFLGLAREGLRRRAGVLVGSRHTAESLWEAIGDAELPSARASGPPGVDVARFAPAGAAAAAAGVDALVERPASAPASRRREAAGQRLRPRSARAAARRWRGAAGRGPLVAFVGKLIVSKGVDLLVAAWPLVLERLPAGPPASWSASAPTGRAWSSSPRARRGDLERGAGARPGRAGRSRTGRPAVPLRHLLAFLDGLRGAGARALPGGRPHARASRSC